ncbi:hypothetical protein [Desulfovibrio ferrophilus]|uniref:Uncharacterized protein n=1 Tax=Desulfovibrio ferrophilus TaxID=241368 RepID=A0A2Z6AW05_9BACT|nr:hypothetical protein [Desulfovibrio ferrophilus]BBD07355.1 uncharacterized protein DFE_0629 [Desulfovibrio ferrophilus]
MSQAAVSSALPFAGLGMDLSPVILRAATMALRCIRFYECCKDLVGRHQVPGLAGFRLLVALSREIRGR